MREVMARRVTAPEEEDELKTKATLSPAEFREQVKIGGLRFVAYLPPTLAEWLLDQIDDELYADPREAIFAIVALYRDLEPHTLSRTELLRRAYEATFFDDPRPSLQQHENVLEQVQALLRPKTDPATWRR